jgi:hypothetical protein
VTQHVASLEGGPTVTPLTRRTKRDIARAIVELLIFVVILVVLALAVGCGMQTSSVTGAKTKGPVPMTTLKTDLTEYVGQEPMSELTMSATGELAYLSENTATTIRVSQDGLTYNSPSDLEATGLVVTFDPGSGEVRFEAATLGRSLSPVVMAEVQRIVAISEQVRENNITQREALDQLRQVVERLAELGVVVANPAAAVGLGEGTPLEFE